MVLSGNFITNLIVTGKLKIEPQPEVKEASIKIHFANSLILKPKQFEITVSKETFELPKGIAGLYDGYTHLARRGIITHLGSMFVDPGTKGNITFEVFNASDQEVKIEAGDRAGHLILLEVKE
jgi:deoxycytidine triphosphate deaminase